MAAIPFVDTHIHLHDMKHPSLRWSWLERDAIHPSLGDIDAIKAQHYWIQDYIAESRFSNVTKAIHVQAALGSADPVEETQWLQAFADRFGFPHGIVAECHLAQPDAEAVLERHVDTRTCAEFASWSARIPGVIRVDSRLQAASRFKLVPCVSTTRRASAQGEPSGCADRGLSRSASSTARFRRSAPKNISPAGAGRFASSAESQNVHVKISGPRDVRPRVDRRKLPSVGARMHRGFQPGAGNVRNELAARSALELLSRPHRGIRRLIIAGFQHGRRQTMFSATRNGCFESDLQRHDSYMTHESRQ